MMAASCGRMARRSLLLWAVLVSFPGSWCVTDLLFVKEPVDVIVNRKDSAILDCLAQGEPPLTITWLKNGAKISESDRISTLHNGSLYIQEVEGRRGEQSDEGFYQCVALNKYGTILSQKAHLSLANQWMQI